MTHDTTAKTTTGAASARATARALKTAHALVFLGLGGWCVLAPATVESLSLREEYRHLSATSALLLQCFGAQAMLVGVLTLLSRFTATTFLVFGLLASVPFFVFNAWFVSGPQDPWTSPLHGWRRLPEVLPSVSEVWHGQKRRRWRR